jgi:hypothetical protein
VVWDVRAVRLASRRRAMAGDRSLLRAIHSQLVARPRLVLAAALVSAVPMGYWSGLLFGDVRADIKELLPEDARSVQTLHRLEERFGNFAELSILIESPDRAANRRFSDDLVARLAPSPHFRSVRNKLGEEKDFFYQRRHLYVEPEDLRTIRDRIDRAATEARNRANPLMVDLDDEEDETGEDPLSVDFSDIEAKYKTKLDQAARFPDDYFESEDGKELVVLARKRGTAFSISENQAVVDFVLAAVAALNPAHYAPGMTVRLGGDVKNMIEEQHTLVGDLVVATVVTSLLLALVVLAYYRSWRSLWLISLPLLIGLTWTFGLGHFLVGHLNASSAFLGPIVAGNGINFGLMLLARYFEERRAGQTLENALERGVVFTARGTVAAAGAAGIAYLSLILTDNRGFNHFGLIAGVGMVLCWIATFAIMPALIAVSERRWPMRAATTRTEDTRWGSWPFKIVERFSGLLAWGGAVGLVVGAALTVHHFRDPFEKDYSKLRSNYARDHGAGAVAKRVDQIFGRYSSPLVILTDRPEDAPEVVKLLEAQIAARDQNKPINEVLALSSLVPANQPERIALLEEIRGLLSENLLSHLDGETRALAEKYRPPAGLEPFTIQDLPETIRADFREKDGTEGRAVLVFPNYELNLYHADQVKRVADAMRAIRLADGRVVESSGNFVIYDDMLLSVSTNGPKASLISVAGVILLLYLLFRRLSWLPVGGALFLGLGLLGAVMHLLDLRINFLNFIALPITVGIGVDYAVNIYARYRLERNQRSPYEAAANAVTATGGAVILCSLTTVIGYGSLLVADNGSLASFGNLAIAGELTCLLAAILVMPAWLFFWAGARKRSAEPVKSL